MYLHIYYLFKWCVAYLRVSKGAGERGNRYKLGT